MSYFKPLYPVPWWSNCCKSQCERPDDIDIGDEFIVRYVGTDCDGNALFCLKKRPSLCDKRPPKPCIMPRG